MASQNISAKMTIQERLRKWAPTPGSICDEAAQVIDALTAENERLREALKADRPPAVDWSQPTAPQTNMTDKKVTDGLNEKALEAELSIKLRAVPTSNIYDAAVLGEAADTLLSQQREIAALHGALTEEFRVSADRAREIERLKDAFALQALIWELEFRARCKLETDLYLRDHPTERKEL